MVEGDGFEPSKAVPADLQSAPFGHSGTPPSVTTNLTSLGIRCQVLDFILLQALEGMYRLRTGRSMSKHLGERKP